jgi:hypothetical protein
VSTASLLRNTVRDQKDRKTVAFKQFHFLTLRDLGVAGPAIAISKGRAVRNCLLKSPEQRIENNDVLTNWIAETLDKAHSFGFLKKQEGFKIDSDRARLYELSHDGLDSIFRDFSLEFEKWMVRRIAFFWAAVLVGVFLMPFFVYAAIKDGILSALGVAAALIAGMGIYGVAIWLVLKLFEFLSSIFYYPIVRLLARGSIKPGKKSTKISTPPPIPFGSQ